jgi:carboxypeptidase Taq
MAAMRRDLVDLDAQIRQGELGGVNRWLREKVHRKGSILMPVSLIEGVCGHVPTEAPLLAYLNTKFSELYDL